MANHDGDMGPAELGSANNHSFEHFVPSFLSQENKELLCAECRRHFPALYAFEKKEELLSVTELLAVAHLRSCIQCTEEYSLLRAALDEYNAGTLPEPDYVPTFDLSFLDASPTEEAEAASTTVQGGDALWLSQTASHMHKLVSDIVITVRAATASFGPLQPPLTPSLAATGIFRSTASQRQIEVLILPAPQSDLSIQLAVGPTTEGGVAMAVQLLELAANLPLYNIRVTLRNSQRQLLAGSVTDEDGSALFEQLQSGIYFIHVRHKQHDWEIPLVLMEKC